MSRFFRNAAILAKIEPTYGVDSVPAAGVDAVLFSAVTLNPFNANNVPRDLIRPFMGGSEQLVGTGFVELSFEVELVGSSAAGTAPAWGPLLRACGAAEAITAGARVEYTPISTAFESVTIDVHMDGARHKMLGCRGSAEIRAGIGDRPVLAFRFLGIDGGASAVPNPSPVLTAWQVPQVVTDPNSGDIILGGTYATAAITGGTAYNSRGFPSINLGNDVQYVPLLGGDSIDIVNRETVGNFSLFLLAAQTASFMTDIKANTLTSVGWTHGSGAGRRVLFFSPRAQRLNYTYDNYNGRLMSNMDLRFVPNTGNDEWRLVTY